MGASRLDASSHDGASLRPLLKARTHTRLRRPAELRTSCVHEDFKDGANTNYLTSLATTAAQTDEFKYWAFISYSHRDKRWADWLHRSLEIYRVPKRLVGQPTQDGLRPRRLFPVFRDREELPVSADLSGRVNKALTQSRYLVVVSSPNAATSHWVNEEIKFFKKLCREDRVLALIVDGEPHSSDVSKECFPEALSRRVGVDGAILPIPCEPIAADVREGKDGKPNTKLKLLAGLFDVNFDALKQRENERRRRLLVGITWAALLFAAAMSAVAAYAIFQEQRADSARQSAEEILNYLLNQLSAKLQPIGHLDIVEDVQKQVETYYKNLGFSPQDPKVAKNWATLLEQEGDRLQAQGDLPGAAQAYEKAFAIWQRSQLARPITFPGSAACPMPGKNWVISV